MSWKFVLAALLYIANMASLVGARSNEYGALWSLAVEEQFYIIWPLIVRRFSLRSLTRLILGYLLFVLLVRLMCRLFVLHTDLTYKLWTNAEALLSGALIAICLRRNLLRRENIVRIGWSLAAVAAVLWPLVVFLDLYWARGGAETFWIRGLRGLAPYAQLFSYCALLLLVISKNQGPLDASRQSLAARFLAFFGYISYGLYLVHQLVFNSLDHLVRGSWLEAERGPGWGLWLNALIGILIATGVAWISRRYYEALFLKQKDKVVPYQEPGVNERPVATEA